MSEVSQGSPEQSRVYISTCPENSDVGLIMCNGFKIRNLSLNMKFQIKWLVTKNSYYRLFVQKYLDSSKRDRRSTAKLTSSP